MVNDADSPLQIASPPEISAVGRSLMLISADAVPVHPFSSFTVSVTVVGVETLDNGYSVMPPKAPSFHEYRYAGTPPVTSSTAMVVEPPAQIVIAFSTSVTVGFSLLWSMVLEALLVQPFASVMITVYGPGVLMIWSASLPSPSDHSKSPLPSAVRDISVTAQVRRLVPVLLVIATAGIGLTVISMSSVTT